MSPSRPPNRLWLPGGRRRRAPPPRPRTRPSSVMSSRGGGLRPSHRPPRRYRRPRSGRGRAGRGRRRRPSRRQGRARGRPGRHRRLRTPERPRHRSGAPGRSRAGITRIVFASSMVVYGEGAYDCPPTAPSLPPRLPPTWRRGSFDPRCPNCGAGLTPGSGARDRPADPRNVYAATKAHGEQLLAIWARETGGRAAALRFHNVYGPGMPARYPVRRGRGPLPLQPGPRTGAAGLRGRSAATQLRLCRRCRAGRAGRLPRRPARRGDAGQHRITDDHFDRRARGSAVGSAGWTAARGHGPLSPRGRRAYHRRMLGCGDGAWLAGRGRARRGHRQSASRALGRTTRLSRQKCLPRSRARACAVAARGASAVARSGRKWSSTSATPAQSSQSLR